MKLKQPFFWFLFLLCVSHSVIAVLNNTPALEDSVKFMVTGRAMLGEATDIAVDGNYVYAALSTGLIIFDKSQPDSFIVVSNTYINPSYASFCEPRIFKEYNYIYFTTGDALHIFDVSNPFIPVNINSLVIEESDIEDVISEKPYIYLGDSWGGEIHILYFNGSDTLNYVNSIPVEDVRQIDLKNDLLYVADGFGGSMRIFSIADPMNPFQVGVYTNYNVGTGVFVRDTLALFSNSQNGLLILNVSDPPNPYKMSEFNPTQRIHRAVADEQYVYASCEGAGFKILDISDPYNPVHISNGNPGGSNLQIKDKILYTAQPKTYHDNIGIQVFDVSDPEYPNLIESFITGANYNDITLYSDLVYVTGWDFGIQIFPNDGIYHPDDITTVLSNYQPEELIFHNDIGFLLAFEGFYILDASNPFSPVIINFIDTPFEPQEIEITDTLIYVACGVEASVWDFPGALQIYDISNPQNPQLISSFISPTTPFFDMEIYNQYVFIIDASIGIRIFDVYNINHPLEVYNFPGRFNRITIDDTLAYVSGNSVLSIFDLRNLPVINQVSQYDLNNDRELFKMYIKDHFAYINDYNNIYAVDVYNPADCSLKGRFFIPDYIENFYFEENNIYASTYQLGAYILTVVQPVSINTNKLNLPAAVNLFQNYPNPFNTQTTIKFELNKAMKIELSIYSAEGRLIDHIVKTKLKAGVYNYKWDASHYASGIYFYKLNSEVGFKFGKCILIK